MACIAWRALSSSVTTADIIADYCKEKNSGRYQMEQSVRGLLGV